VDIPGVGAGTATCPVATAQAKSISANASPASAARHFAEGASLVRTSDEFVAVIEDGSMLVAAGRPGTLHALP